MYTPTQSSFGTFGRNEDKGDMTNGMFFQMSSRCKIRTFDKNSMRTSSILADCISCESHCKLSQQ